MFLNFKKLSLVAAFSFSSALFASNTFQVPVENTGFQVDQVKAGSPLSKAGVLAGDTVLKIDQEEINFNKIEKLFAENLSCKVIDIKRNGQLKRLGCKK